MQTQKTMKFKTRDQLENEIEYLYKKINSIKVQIHNKALDARKKGCWSEHCAYEDIIKLINEEIEDI